MCSFRKPTRNMKVSKRIFQWPWSPIFCVLFSITNIKLSGYKIPPSDRTYYRIPCPATFVPRLFNTTRKTPDRTRKRPDTNKHAHLSLTETTRRRWSVAASSRRPGPSPPKVASSSSSSSAPVTSPGARAGSLTVEGNKEHFTRRDVMKADQARQLLKNMCFPTMMMSSTRTISSPSI